MVSNLLCIPFFVATCSEVIFLQLILTRCINTHFLLSVDERESLNFKLVGMKDYEALSSKGEESKTEKDNLGSWGHEFVRSLAGEIGQDDAARAAQACSEVTCLAPRKN